MLKKNQYSIYLTNWNYNLLQGLRLRWRWRWFESDLELIAKVVDVAGKKNCNCKHGDALLQKEQLQGSKRE